MKLHQSGLLYRNRWLYNLFLKSRYRKGLAVRYEPLLKEIPQGSTVCEFCCGTGTFWEGVTYYVSTRDLDVAVAIADAGFDPTDVVSDTDS